MLYCGRSFWVYHFCKHAREAGACGAPYVCDYAETLAGLDPRIEAKFKRRESKRLRKIKEPGVNIWVKVLIIELFVLLAVGFFLIVRWAW